MDEYLRFQNDLFRVFGPSQSIPGRCLMTRGVGQIADRQAVVDAVRLYPAQEFEENSEHDFGVVHVDGHKLFWKIDYYQDSDCDSGADSPAEKCYRVLTVMLAEEY